MYTGVHILDNVRRVDRIGIRQLRTDCARAVQRAGAGERIVITVDGRPVAQLGPLEAEPGRVTLDDLVARDLVVGPRSAERPEPVVTMRLWAGVRSERVLREVRG